MKAARETGMLSSLHSVCNPLVNTSASD